MAVSPNPVPVGTSPTVPAGAYTDHGTHNHDPEKTKFRILKGASYRDLSTVCVLPTPTEYIHHRVEAAIDGLIKPMNQPYAGPMRLSGPHPLEKIQVVGCEVGDAYNTALANIKANPTLASWKFMLTIEHDNLPPPDGMLKLQAQMYEHADKDDQGRVLKDENGIYRFHFLGIGGLYFCRGEGGAPMIYGHPGEFPANFRPQIPLPDTLQECRGVAMGFTLWNLSALMNDKRLGPPWFETKAEWDPMKGISVGTQDLVACAKALQFGYRFAVDTSVKVGHMDLSSGIVW